MREPVDSHSRPCVDCCRAIGGIILIIGNGLRQRDASEATGHKILYKRWSRMGVFRRIFENLASEGPRPQRLIIDTAFDDRVKQSISKT